MRFRLFQSLRKNISLVCFTCYNYYEIEAKIFNFIKANPISRFFYEPGLTPAPTPATVNFRSNSVRPRARSWPRWFCRPWSGSIQNYHVLVRKY